MQSSCGVCEAITGRQGCGKQRLWVDYRVLHGVARCAGRVEMMQSRLLPRGLPAARGAAPLRPTSEKRGPCPAAPASSLPPPGAPEPLPSPSQVAPAERQGLGRRDRRPLTGKGSVRVDRRSCLVAVPVSVVTAAATCLSGMLLKEYFHLAAPSHLLAGTGGARWARRLLWTYCVCKEAQHTSASCPQQGGQLRIA